MIKTRRFLSLTIKIKITTPSLIINKSSINTDYEHFESEGVSDDYRPISGQSIRMDTYAPGKLSQ